MELVPIYCPNCGGKIQVPAGKDQCYCMYCGTQLAFDDGSKVITFRTVDEARIKEADLNAMLELKRLEIESEKRRSRMQALKIAAIVSGALLILALIVGYFVDFSVGMLIGELAVFVILVTALPRRNSANDQVNSIDGED